MITKQKLAISILLLAILVTISVPTIAFATHSGDKNNKTRHADHDSDEADDESSEHHLKLELPMSGSNEIPPVNTRATGTIEAKLTHDGLTVKFDLEVCDISHVTMAHFHVGAPGTNGPVILFLYGPDSTGAFSAEGCQELSSGKLTSADLKPTTDPNAPIPIRNWDDVVAALFAGNLYANVHTTAHPGGEIRAQLVPSADTDNDD